MAGFWSSLKNLEDNLSRFWSNLNESRGLLVFCFEVIWKISGIPCVLFLQLFERISWIFCVCFLKWFERMSRTPRAWFLKKLKRNFWDRFFIFEIHNLKEPRKTLVANFWSNLKNFGDLLCLVFEEVWKNFRNSFCLVFEVVWKNLLCV